ncbi:MAG: TrkA C-terminal domain-containing protein, partial [Halanaeroarchaeum sp.]
NEDHQDWVVSPGPETRLHPGDVLIAKGTEAGAQRLTEIAA